MKKGNAISIKTRLKNISNFENVSYQYIIIRYFHERLLYRIVNSAYANHFFLKGGALLYAIEGLHIRPTVDIDMLAKHISADKEQIKQVFQEICSIEYGDDCVFFDIDSIETSEISEDTKYGGVRVLVVAGLDTIRQRLQIDIGFGDVITPAPAQVTYPVLLDELAKPEIKAYPIETVVAEKFQAMIAFGTFNSRMKDFFDVYILLNNRNIDEDNLREAILQTFKNRNTDFVKEHELFSKNFCNPRQVMWNAFLRKMKISCEMDFETVLKTILERLYPIYCALSNVYK